MDSARFDAIARMFSARRNRRSAVAGGLGLAGLAAGIAPFGSERVTAQDATPAAATPETVDPHPNADLPAKTEFLFVQPFTGGSWAPKANEEGVFTLALTGAGANTVYFSDRPERVFGLAPTQTFLDGLGFTPENPPNAALVVPGSDGAEEILVVELLGPVYDAETAGLSYDARVLADYDGDGLRDAATRQTDYAFPERFTEGSLFIDGCDDEQFICLAPNTGREIDWVNVGTCWSWSDVKCKPCHDPAGYCASAFPTPCLYQERDANGNVIGIGYLCEAWPAWKPRS